MRRSELTSCAMDWRRKEGESEKKNQENWEREPRRYRKHALPSRDEKCFELSENLHREESASFLRGASLQTWYSRPTLASSAAAVIWYETRSLCTASRDDPPTPRDASPFLRSSLPQWLYYILYAPCRVEKSCRKSQEILSNQIDIWLDVIFFLNLLFKK